MASLSGKIAIVTGASRGIGRAIAERLATEGASVVINYAHGADKAEEVVSAVIALGGQALAVQADLSKVVDVRRLFQETVDHFGNLDILVNNAGIGTIVSITDVTESEFDRIFALNAKGTFFAIQEAARRMTDGGRIINISSTATTFPQPQSSVYAGSKGAVEQFTAIAAEELGKRSITVNTVSPGGTMTELFQTESTPAMREFVEKSSPLGRAGRPEDIADVVAFLASEQARWLTGQRILANGGGAI